MMFSLVNLLVFLIVVNCFWVSLLIWKLGMCELKDTLFCGLGYVGCWELQSGIQDVLFMPHRASFDTAFFRCCGRDGRLC